MAALPSDNEIRRDVLDALSRDARLDASSIAVAVAAGDVTLRGVVASAFEKRLAIDLARRTKGVRRVRDELRVELASPRSDAEIAREIRADLASSPQVDASRIDVEVRGGIVYLRGTVANLDQKQQADEIAWWTAGVRDVVNELELEQTSEGNR